jgi:Do/DeqQ family serine protease
MPRIVSLLLVGTLGLVVGLGLAIPRSGPAAIPLLGGDRSAHTLAPMLKQVMPSVVNIASKARVKVSSPLLDDPFFRRFFGQLDLPREQQTQSLGSGVVVDAKGGYILTNRHVIEGADQITVTLQDGRKFNAKVVGSDPGSDIAVIRIDADRLEAIRLGDSDKLEVGDFVVAIGNPFGLGQTVTSGIVSALGRSGLGIEGYEDFIQTDASINPGNSGGALVDLDGELVGINTAIVAPSGGNVGIGFAIPVNMARGIMDQLIQYGEVRRGELGVHVQDLTPELARAFGIHATRGAVVASVVPRSPADEAKLRAGDVIVAVGGRPIHDAADLRNTVGLLRIGQRVTVDILRRDQNLQVEARIARPETARLDGGRLSDYLAGAVMGEVQGQRIFGADTGIQVLDIQQGSPAWNAGLRKGDVILSVNRQAVNSLDDLRRVVERSDQGLLLNIRRRDGALFLLMR